MYTVLCLKSLCKSHNEVRFPSFYLMLIKFNSFRPHYFVILSVSAVTSNNLRVNEKKQKQYPMHDNITP